MNERSSNKSTVSYHHKPENLTIEDWQSKLRKQFVIGKPFVIKRITEKESPFGDYSVLNPETGNSYKVAFRGIESPMNFCSCMDFKTNQLGTCKHLEAVVRRLDSVLQNPIFQCYEYTPAYTSVYLSYRNNREVKIRIGSNKRDEFEALVKTYFDDKRVLLTESFQNFEHFLEQAKALDDSFRCYDDALAFALEMREQEKRKFIIENKYQSATAFHKLINASLYPYQQEGIRFAFEAGRSLIADEMGLGKTIQAIATAELFRKELGIEKVLIICPTSLKYQWQSEIKKFANQNALVIEGAPHIRCKQYEQDDFFKIVSYHTIANDLSYVLKEKFDLIILDEAQRIKNWKTKIAQAIKKIQSPYGIVLTGTPLENKLEELYSIVQFVNPFQLGPYYRFLDYYQIKNETGKIVGYQHLNEISKHLAHLVIRRKKKDVLLQLPERVDKNLFVPMTEEQQQMHDSFKSNVASLVHKWKRMGFLTEKDRQHLMIGLNMMRMSCNSTFLVDQQTRSETKIGELMSILNDFFDGNQEKVVIFSQWERMTRIIAQELDAAGIQYEYLYGGVASKDRKALLENFTNSPNCRVFLSTDAGSTGLNLQAASMIINMDIPWNPSVLEQRIARIHRMGQKNSISVLNFISQNTIEHRMLDVLRFKSSLSEGILDQGENTIFMSDSKFNIFMKGIDDMTSDELLDKKHTPILNNDETLEGKQLSLKEGLKTDDTNKPVSEYEIPGDDDVKPIDDKTAKTSTSLPKNIEEPEELLSVGINFLSSLAKTLSSKESTKKLVHSLIEEDESTGKKHLKIPVENEESITNILNLIGRLFK